MNIKKSISGLAILSAFFLLFFSCSLETKTQQPFLIYADSIQSPDTVDAGVVFEVKLFGIIGPNGCYKLEKIYSYQNYENEVMIEPWGVYIYDGTACSAGISYLTGKTEITITEPGDYTLKVIRPDYTYLDKTVTVN
ncbi:MAG: hypothetical protein GYA41_14115 [Bacteroidales bacterium]|nr:hypothetical protein [Bacteroidales bacterium]